MARLSHVEVMLAISMALGVAAWLAESKLWDYAFIASLVLFVLVVAVSLIKRKAFFIPAVALSVMGPILRVRYSSRLNF